MKTRIYLQASIIMLSTGLSLSSYCQEQKVQKQNVTTVAERQRQECNFYRKTLQVDSVIAMQVSKLQNTYKSALQALISDTSLNDAAKRARISTLMEIKNKQLRSLLSPAQQKKIIPTTEQISSEPVK